MSSDVWCGFVAALQSPVVTLYAIAGLYASESRVKWRMWSNVLSDERRENLSVREERSSLIQ